jgi:hypothetical protein
MESFWAGRFAALELTLPSSPLKSLAISTRIALQCSIRSATIATSDGVRRVI